MTSPKLVNAGLLIVLLGGCNLPNGGRPVGLTASQAADCRTRSEEIYTQQNRAAIYQSDAYATSTRDSPFSTNGLPGITSQGLGQQFGREKALDACYNAAGSVGNPPSASGTPNTTASPNSTGTVAP